MSLPDETLITCRIDGDIAMIGWNRPSKCNAVSDRVIEACRLQLPLRNARSKLRHWARRDLTILHSLGRFPYMRQCVMDSVLRIKRALGAKIMRACILRNQLAAKVPAVDRRAITLALTEAGQVLLSQEWPKVALAEAQAAANLGRPEQSGLLRFLLKFIGTRPAADMERPKP